MAGLQISRLHQVHHNRIARFVRSLLLLAAAGAFEPSSVDAQMNRVSSSLRGKVLEQATESPVAGALVEFIDGRTRIRGKAMTDENGTFSIAELSPGNFRLRVTALGYAKTMTPYWRLQRNEILFVNVRVDPQAVPLAPLEISARARKSSPMLEAFYDRMRLKVAGTFLNREDIKLRNAALVTDLLTNVPGIQFESSGTGNTRLVSFAGRSGFGGTECPIQIFVDGVLASRRGIASSGEITGNARGVSLDELATPLDLEGIEVYRGLSTIPAEFLTPDSRCGIIALWTVRGGG